MEALIVLAVTTLSITLAAPVVAYIVKVIINIAMR
jgi:hypothetical protein